MSMLVAVVLGVIGLALIIAGVNNSGMNIFRAVFGGAPLTAAAAGKTGGQAAGSIAGRALPGTTSRAPAVPQ